MKKMAIVLGSLVTWNAFYKCRFSNEVAPDGKREIRVTFKPRWK